MKFTKCFIIAYVLAASLLCELIFALSAYAYIDPNAGGFFFQTVAPIIYGLLGVIVVFWRRITGFVKGLFNRLTNKNSPAQHDE